jgi:hypothetical protein
VLHFILESSRSGLGAGFEPRETRRQKLVTVPRLSQQAFLESVSIRNCSFDNYLWLYSDIVARIVALNCGTLSGDFVLYADRSKEERVLGLNEVRRLQQQESKLLSALRKEKWLNCMVDLNLKIKHVSEEIAVADNFDTFIERTTADG